MTRCFIAIELSEDAGKEISRVQSDLKRKSLLSGRYVEPANMHLTLKFLGEIDDAMLAKVKDALKAVQFKGFDASLGAMGVFTEQYIRVVWTALESKEIYDLQKKIDDSLEKLFPKDKRFSSHVTIVRPTKVPDKKALLEYIRSVKPERISFKIDSFVLKKSVLTPEGPVYSDVEKYLLM